MVLVDDVVVELLLVDDELVELLLVELDCAAQMNQNDFKMNRNE